MCGFPSIHTEENNLQIIYSKQKNSNCILKHAFLDILEGTFRCFVPYEDCKCELAMCFWQEPSMALAAGWLQQSVDSVAIGGIMELTRWNTNKIPAEISKAATVNI